MAVALIVAGVLAHAAGYFWLVVLAYRETPTAGRIALFVWPLAFMVMLLRRDATAVKAFVLAAAGLAMAWGGSALLPDAPPEPDILKVIGPAK